MPANFPEIWLGRVIDNLEKGDVATWLEGIAEIATNVTTINEGTLSEKQIIHVPVTDFDVDVSIIQLIQSKYNSTMMTQSKLL